MDMIDGPYLRTDYETTPKWAWSGSHDLVSKFWVPLNNLWTNWAIRFKFGTKMEDVRVWTIKWPLSRRGLGHVTKFR